MMNIKKFILTMFLLSVSSSPVLSMNGLIKHRAKRSGSFYVSFIDGKEFSDPHFSYTGSDHCRGDEHITFLAIIDRPIEKDLDKNNGYMVTLTKQTWGEALSNNPNQSRLASVRIFFKKGSTEAVEIQIKPAGRQLDVRGKKPPFIMFDKVELKDHQPLVEDAVEFLRYARAAVDSLYGRHGDLECDTRYEEPESHSNITNAINFIRHGLFNGHQITIPPKQTRKVWGKK